MYELTRAIPDYEVLLALEPEELGAKILFLLRNRSQQTGMFSQNEQQFAQYSISRMFPKDALHPKISNTVWMALMREEFDVAVFQAMKAVEVAVRDASGFPEQ